MTPVTTSSLPASASFSPLAGFEPLLIAMVLVAVGAVAALVVLAAGKGVGARAEWRAWLDGRSARRREP